MTSKKLDKKKERMILVSIRVPSETIEVFKVNADLFTEGNMSLWLRCAGERYAPKKGEVITEGIVMAKKTAAVKKAPAKKLAAKKPAKKASVKK